jgi:putative hydrolase of the HAD superfamily
VTPITAVLFDLDDTLCQHEQSAETVYEGAFESAGVDSFGVPTDLWRALDGPPDPDDPEGYLAAGFESVAAQYGHTEVDTASLARGFLDTVDYTAVSFRPGAAAALERAREHGLVGLVTNGPEHRQSIKLGALDIQDAFDVCVFAGDMPRRKPYADPFERALSALDVVPDATVHVGDSLEYDVAGARDAGLRAAWYPTDGDRDHRDYRPDYVFDTLRDLEPVLEPVE